MKIKNLLYQIKSPCKECPYKLGLVQMVVSPCPQCRLNGYDAYERFKSHAREDGKRG